MQLHLDTTFGFDGMSLAGALAHLGVDMRPVLSALQQLDLPCRLLNVPQGPAGPGFRLTPADEALPADGLWPVSGLHAALESLPLPDEAREQAEKALRLLVEAQAQAHGVRPEGLAFAAREGVFVLLSLAAACWALALGRKALGITRVTASPLPWSSGTTQGPRGPLPLPSPAAALLLRGLPLRRTENDSDYSADPLPADGVALARVLPDAFELPEGIVRGLGVGYRPSGDDVWLRVWVLEEEETTPETPPVRRENRREETPDAQRRGGNEQIAQLETHLDHLTGEELGAALEALAALPEVLDVLWLPGLGKKSRPSGVLRLLCAPRHREVAATALLRHTHSLGVRYCLLERTVLPRGTGRCLTGQALGPEGVMLPAKLYRLEGRDYARPEADAVREAAAALGVGVPALRMSRPDEY